MSKEEKEIEEPGWILLKILLRLTNKGEKE